MLLTQQNQKANTNKTKKQTNKLGIVGLPVAMIPECGPVGWTSTPLHIKRILTVNTMYYMKPQKPNLKVMDP